MALTIDLTTISQDLCGLPMPALNYTPPAGFSDRLLDTVHDVITAWMNQEEVDPYGQWLDPALDAAAEANGVDWEQMAADCTGEQYDLLADPEVRSLAGYDEGKPSEALARYFRHDTYSATADALRSMIEKHTGIDPANDSEALVLPTDPSVRYVRVKDLSDHTLIGEAGGLSRVTGYVEPSATVEGTYLVETEHGTLHLDPNERVLVAGERGISMTVRGVRSCETEKLSAGQCADAFREALVWNMAEVSLLDGGHPLRCA